jgi:SAM-dependent methyltransferase
MHDSLDVEDLMERIRQLARARLRGPDGSIGVTQPASIGQRLKSVWQAVKWYADHPDDCHETLTTRLLSARAVDELQRSLAELSQRMDRLDVQQRGIDAAIAHPFWSHASGRIVENAWVLRHLGELPYGATVLDVGCAETLLSLELASNGFRVTGVDIRRFPLQHPNFHFFQGDIANAPLADDSFDAAVLLSSIDVRLGWYVLQQGENRAAAAMTRIYELIKPGGQLILTVPFGEAVVTRQRRIFDSQQLRQLLHRFDLQTLEFGVNVDKKTWVLPASEEAAQAQVDDPESLFPGAVALAVCKKPLS